MIDTTAFLHKAIKGGKRLLFYTVWEDAHGLYTLETAAGAQAQRLPWFGGWRWRDADSVYLAPLDAFARCRAASHREGA